MKKILIIIFVILCIFQMVVLAVDIDIGSVVIYRDSFWSVTTLVNKNNPANLSGKITSVEIWCNANLSDCEVATFYVVSGNNLSTRDTHNIGNVTAGSKQTFSGLNITVEAGDYIGIYYSAGIYGQNPGGDGIWYIESADHIPCTNTTFGLYAGGIISLYGTGTTEEEEEEEANSIFFGINF